MGRMTREQIENAAEDLPEEEIDDAPPDLEEDVEDIEPTPTKRRSTRKRKMTRREEPMDEPYEEPVDFEEDDIVDSIDDDGWDDTDPATYNLEDVFKKYWRPIAAYVYLAICLFDFIAMPIYKETLRDNVNTQAFAEVMKIKDKDVQLKALEQLELNKIEWSPITLEGGGLFHISFGAILGVAAWTRGAEKRAAIEGRMAGRNAYGRPMPTRRRYY